MRASVAVTLTLAALSAAPGPADAAPRATRATRRAGPKAAPAAAALPASAAAPEPIRHGANVGAVVHVTAGRAYLDVGAAHGLAPGQLLRLLRGGEPAGVCEVEAVAPHHATCRAPSPQRGDLVRVTPPAPRPAPKALPPLVSAEELDRRAAVVAGQPVPRVEARVEAAPVPLEAVRPAEVGAAHAAWSSTGSRAWHAERVDATVRGAETFGGMRLYADLRAARWTARPAGFRSRPVERTQLHVHEAALASRDPARPWTLAVGRVLPFAIPGATSFDGVQLGVGGAGGAEAGVFGGLVPDPSTTSLTLDRSTGGVYAALDHGRGSLVAREELRAAVTTSPELGTRLEGELRTLLLVARRVNVQGDLRVGVGGRHRAEAGVDVAQVDVAGRPLPRVQLSGLFRYAGLSAPDAPAPALFAGPERRWDGSAGYDLGPAVLSAAGGQGRDLSSGLERWWVGPELAFPRLFGARGGASLGYAEERGWVAGRTAWAQAALRTGPLRLSGRLSWTADSRDGADDDHALGLLAAAGADVARWLSVRASVLARAGARGLDLGDPAQGVTALIGIASRF